MENIIFGNKIKIIKINSSMEKNVEALKGSTTSQ
jgi:hypothetical protein